MSSYINAKTTIYIEGRKVGDFAINRDVKQGDPLSPFLFNLVMDEVIFNMNKDHADRNFQLCIKYADDLILLNDSVGDGRLSLAKYSGSLKNRNFSINPAKCMALTTDRVPRKKSIRSYSIPILVGKYTDPSDD